jgi:hypothetical protein
MQVVSELVWYLNERRLLAADDLRALRRRGFIDFVEEAELLALHAVAVPWDVRRDEPEEDAAEAFRPRVRQRRSFPKTRPRPKEGAASARVLALWPHWAAQLTGFARLAHAIAANGALADRLVALCGLDEPALDSVVTTAIATDVPPLALLWRAVDFRGYLALGATPVALREILKGRRHVELGRYAAALRYPGLARLYLLIQAQRAVGTAIGRLLAVCPTLFDRALFARGYHPGCYWTLTLLASARVASPEGWPLRVHAPTRPLPSHGQLSAALACAATIDGRLLPWLAEGRELPPLRCPRSWDLGYFAAAEAPGRAV